MAIMGVYGVRMSMVDGIIFPTLGKLAYMDIFWNVQLPRRSIPSFSNGVQSITTLSIRV
jgi:hypothetical protein